MVFRTRDIEDVDAFVPSICNLWENPCTVRDSVGPIKISWLVTIRIASEEPLWKIIGPTLEPEVLRIVEESDSVSSISNKGLFVAPCLRQRVMMPSLLL